MTIDEAIAHAREVAEKNRKDYEWYSKNPKVWKDGGKKQRECFSCVEEYEQLVKWLEELKEHREFAPDINVGNKSEWIPVTEDLPDNNEPVLCWVKSTTIASGETYIIGSCSNKCWFLQTYEIGHHHFPVKDYEVVAWCELPEPYKEEREE